MAAPSLCSSSPPCLQAALQSLLQTGFKYAIAWELVLLAATDLQGGLYQQDFPTILSLPFGQSKMVFCYPDYLVIMTLAVILGKVTEK